MFRTNRSGIAPLGADGAGASGLLVALAAIGLAALAFLLTSGVLPSLLG